jgi:ATP-dependent 26S proteasome regulatory subunit
VVVADRDATASQGAQGAMRDLVARLRAEGVAGRRTGPARPGVRAVIQGRSASERAEAAQRLATELGRDLLRIDLAEVVRTYIGETEKNLDQLLQSAEEGGAVLFFDEADALFERRSEVKDCRDRYAGLEASHLLQCLSRFRGAAVFATSTGLRMDPAVAPRMDMVIDISRPEMP